MQRAVSRSPMIHSGISSSSMLITIAESVLTIPSHFRIGEQMMPSDPLFEDVTLAGPRTLHKLRSRPLENQGDVTLTGIIPRVIPNLENLGDVTLTGNQFPFVRARGWLVEWGDTLLLTSIVVVEVLTFFGVHP